MCICVFCICGSVCVSPSAGESEAAGCKPPRCSSHPPGEDPSTCKGTWASTHAHTFTKGHKKFNASPLGATVWQPETLPGINHIPHCLVQSVSLTHLSHTHTSLKCTVGKTKKVSETHADGAESRERLSVGAADVAKQLKESLSAA